MKKLLSFIGVLLTTLFFGAGIAAAAPFIVPQGGTGVATLTATQLLVGNGANAVYSVATSSATCSSGASCTAFTIVGSGGTTITTTLGTTVAANELASADFGSFTCNGTSCTVDNDAIALATQTTGNYLATLSSSGSITVGNSGSENAAATVNLNMANANTWTALQTFANSSTTLASFDYASSTVWRGGGLSSDCDTAATSKLLWDATTGQFSCGTDQNSGGGGSGNVATSTGETAGNLAYWTSTNGTPATLGKVATTSATCAGNAVCDPFVVIGSAPVTITASGGSGTGLATSTAIASGDMIFGTSVSTVGADAGFTYSAAADRLTLVNASTTALSSAYASSTILVGGTLTVSTSLTIGGDTIDEFVGAGLTLSSGDLTVDNVTAAMLNNEDFGDFSCNGTTCTVDANSVALTTDTTGNYVATLADDGQSTVTVTNGSTEGGAATLRVIDVVCTDCLGTTEIADSYLLNNGDVGTGDYDFGGANFEIPNGASPTVDAIGEIALDTTYNELVVATSTNASFPAVWTAEQKIWGRTVASSSVDMVSGGRIPLPPTNTDWTITKIICIVDGGTSVVINVDTLGGGSNTTQATCATTLTTQAVSSNSSVASTTAYANEFGTVTGAVDYVTFSVWGYPTRH